MAGVFESFLDSRLFYSTIPCSPFHPSFLYFHCTIGLWRKQRNRRLSAFPSSIAPSAIPHEWPAAVPDAGLPTIVFPSHTLRVTSRMRGQVTQCFFSSSLPGSSLGHRQYPSQISCIAFSSSLSQHCLCTTRPLITALPQNLQFAMFPPPVLQ